LLFQAVPWTVNPRTIVILHKNEMIVNNFFQKFFIQAFLYL